MIALFLALFTFMGLSVIFGLLIADMRDHAKHEAWRRENNHRRHNL